MFPHTLVAAYAIRFRLPTRGPRAARGVMKRLGAVLAAATAIALGAPPRRRSPGPLRSTSTPQSSAVVGRPLVIMATGTVPPQDVGFPYWFSLDAIPAAVTTTCPADQGEGAQFALGSGGSIVVLSQTQHPNLAGDFMIPVAVTPSAPGSLLLCGYTDDGGAVTLARTSLLLHIKPRREPPQGQAALLAHPQAARPRALPAPGPASSQPVGLIDPARLWLTASMLWPSGSRTNAP